MKGKKTLLTVSALLLAFGLAGCGGATSSYADAAYKNAEAPEAAGAYEDYDYDYAEESAAFGEDIAIETEGAKAEEVNEEAASSQKSNRKLIRTVSMDLETTKLDDLMGEIKSRVKSSGGYIEDSSVDTISNYNNVRRRNAYFTIRIPAEKLDDFLTVIDGRANVVSSSENVKDVTLDYVDMESHKKTLQAESDRVLELMEQTNDIEDMLVLENRLSELRYQIESMESQLRTYDNQVTYSTVNLTIEEVIEYTEIEEPEPETFWTRLSGGFTDSLSGVADGFLNFIVWLASALPYLVVWGIIIFVIFLIVRAIIRKINSGSEKRMAKKNEKRAKQGLPPIGYVEPLKTMTPPQAPAAPAPGQPAPQVIPPAQKPNVPSYEPEKAAKEDKKADKKDKNGDAK